MKNNIVVLILILFIQISVAFGQSALLDRKQNALSIDIGKTWGKQVSPYHFHMGYSFTGFIDVGLMYSSGEISKSNNYEYDLSQKAFGFDFSVIFLKPTIKVQPFGLALNVAYSDLKYERLDVLNSGDNKEFKANVTTPSIVFYSLSEINNNRIVISFSLGYSVTTGGIEDNALESNFISLGLSANVMHNFTERLSGVWSTAVGLANESLSAGISIGMLYKTKI